MTTVLSAASAAVLSAAMAAVSSLGRMGRYRILVLPVLALLLALTGCEDDDKAPALLTHTGTAPECVDGVHSVATRPYQLPGGQEIRGEADVCIVFSEAGGPLDRPLIIVDGIDALDRRHWNQVQYRKGVEQPDTLYELLNQDDLLTELQVRFGVDFIVVDPTGDGDRGGGDLIQANALGLLDTIRWVKNNKVAGAPTAIVGPSMGGVIARYALAYAEQNQIDHDVDLFVSWDAPHRGANIPLGNQYWLNFFATWGDPDVTEAVKRVPIEQMAILNSPVARQLLLVHHQDAAITDVTVAPDSHRSERVQLMSELDALGYPNNSRNVAIANGNSKGEDRFSAGQQMLDWDNGGPRINFKCRSWALRQGSVFDCEAELPRTNTRTQRRSVAQAFPNLDGAPGSNITTSVQIAAPKLHWSAGDIKSKVSAETHIPTVSALDIDAPVDAAAELLLDGTPFDAVHVPSANEDHVKVTPENRAFLIEELSAIFSPIGPDTPTPEIDAASLTTAFGPGRKITNVAFDSNGDVRHRQLVRQGVWTSWVNLGGPDRPVDRRALEIESNPKADLPGAIEIYVFDIDGNLWSRRQQTDDTWSDWANLGRPADRPIAESLDVSLNPNGDLLVWTTTENLEFWAYTPDGKWTRLDDSIELTNAIGPTASCQGELTGYPKLILDAKPNYIQKLHEVTAAAPFGPVFDVNAGKIANGRERVIQLETTWEPGIYVMKGGSYDGYVDRKLDSQPNETWRVIEFRDGDGNRVSNGSTMSVDLPDGEEANWEGPMVLPDTTEPGGSIQITGSASQIVIGPGTMPGEAHGSVHPVCISAYKVAN